MSLPTTGVVYACIAPHGSEVIPELAAVGARGGGTPVGAPAAVAGPGNLETALAKFRVLTRAMEDIGRRVRLADPDTVVLATPHNLRLDGGYTAVVTSELVSGSLTAQAASDQRASEGNGAAGATVRASFRCDRPLAADIVARARKAGLPVVGVNYGALDGPNSVIPLDWGSLIPLYFIGRRSEGPEAGVTGVTTVGPWEPALDGRGGEERPKVVLIGPGREAPRASLVTLGRQVAEAAAASGRRVVFVASCDHGHAHLPAGPYGYDPASAEYDRLVCRVVGSGRLEDLVDLDPALVEAGKPDSLWQMLILAGVLGWLAEAGRPLVGRVLAYEVPTYFGMLCASYEPCPEERPSERPSESRLSTSKPAGRGPRARM